MIKLSKKFIGNKKKLLSCLLMFFFLIFYVNAITEPIDRNIGKISSNYGKRTDPTTKEKEFHRGVDIKAPEGTAVKSTGDGIVIRAGYDPILGYSSKIRHNDGTETVYGHMKKGSILVKSGQTVKPGTKIGEVGCSGHCTGPHLHYAVLAHDAPLVVKTYGLPVTAIDKYTYKDKNGNVQTIRYVDPNKILEAQLGKGNTFKKMYSRVGLEKISATSEVYGEYEFVYNDVNENGILDSQDQITNFITDGWIPTDDLEWEYDTSSGWYRNKESGNLHDTAPKDVEPLKKIQINSVEIQIKDDVFYQQNNDGTLRRLITTKPSTFTPSSYPTSSSLSELESDLYSKFSDNAEFFVDSQGNVIKDGIKVWEVDLSNAKDNQKPSENEILTIKKGEESKIRQSVIDVSEKYRRDEVLKNYLVFDINGQEFAYSFDKKNKVDRVYEVDPTTKKLGQEITSNKNPIITKVKQELQRQKTEQAAYELTWTLLDLTLGKFAYGYVEDYCRDQYDSSDYGTESGTPVSLNPPQPPNPQAATLEEQNCIDDVTTVTAQTRKATFSAGFTYVTSWTVTPCKENVQYAVYLANDIDDRIGIAEGTANKGTIKSDRNQFSYTRDYNSVCIETSDSTIGDNGDVCFTVV